MKTLLVRVAVGVVQVVAEAKVEVKAEEILMKRRKSSYVIIVKGLVTNRLFVGRNRRMIRTIKQILQIMLMIKYVIHGIIL